MICSIEFLITYYHANFSIACRNFIYEKPSMQEGGKN